MRILTLTGRDKISNRELINRYSSLLEGVEIRLDLLAGDAGDPAEAAGAILETAREHGLSVVLSCRRRNDGGSWQGGEESRLSLLERALRAGVAYLDLEEEPAPPYSGVRRLEQRAERVGARLIGSLHDFRHIPRDWEQRLQRISAAGRIPKLACTPEDFAAAAEMYRRLRRSHMPQEKIVLLMGPVGFFSRILYRRFGSLFTFVSDPARTAMPWHPDPETLTRLYRAEQVDEDTPLYGVIGNPVHHSRSPQLHNRWLAAAGLPGTYLPFQVEEAEPFFRFAEEAGVRGFSVTLPLKEKVLPLLDSVSSEVERIGSCNTVVRSNGGWRGWNTDFSGFLAPLEGQLRKGRIRRVLIVGAGGVARTAAAAVSERGAELTVVNRTAEKARRLTAEFGGSWVPREEAGHAGPFDLVVQTTSAGMEPAIDEDPLPEYRFAGNELVYELIYTPETTSFLSRALQAGCSTLGGAGMLRAQAEEQFRLFTGRRAPPDA
jgi:3-dehydroquinate dehydratase/shikimate dehydrogenase